MSITKVLGNKELSSQAKLEKVASTVAAARKAYGNVDAEIPAPMVNTTNGSLEFNHLDDDSKVEVLKPLAAKIKAQAIEFCRNNKGAVIDKKIEELVATNPTLANIAPGTEFAYL